MAGGAAPPLRSTVVGRQLVVLLLTLFVLVAPMIIMASAARALGADAAYCIPGNTRSGTLPPPCPPPSH
ncbi:hypothetical protein E2562_016103 [Oryza meyeriana var. granulata]|uniref:Uncharacterized protein n=1 Tax=Oryza meyeriana var. granulata TaxID=110450 RepID=A0A6G1BJX7_9ORYZ|nr:hypothetical protein E2562_016103 [Oryza meyeriana var. granulata]